MRRPLLFIAANVEDEGVRLHYLWRHSYYSTPASLKMSEQPGLKREGTMAVTAQEGEAFLESQGMKVTDDDAKTRAQKDKLEEITNDTSDTSDKPKLGREGTMAVTAKEGQELLGDEALEKTRAQTAFVKEAEASPKEESPKKPRVPRESTMAVTAQEGQQLLEGEELEKTRAQTASQKSPTATTPTKVKRTTTIAQTAQEASAHILGSEERGRTRSQTRKLSESGEEKEKKPSVKRSSTMAQTAKEGEEFLEREAKRAKIDEDAGGEGEKGEETRAED